MLFLNSQKTSVPCTHTEGDCRSILLLRDKEEGNKMISQQRGARTRDRCPSPTCRDRLTGPQKMGRSFGMGRAPAPRHTTSGGGAPKELGAASASPRHTVPALGMCCFSALSSSGAFPSSLPTSRFPLLPAVTVVQPVMQTEWKTTESTR